MNELSAEPAAYHHRLCDAFDDACPAFDEASFLAEFCRFTAEFSASAVAEPLPNPAATSSLLVSALLCVGQILKVVLQIAAASVFGLFVDKMWLKGVIVGPKPHLVVVTPVGKGVRLSAAVAAASAAAVALELLFQLFNTPSAVGKNSIHVLLRSGCAGLAGVCFIRVVIFISTSSGRVFTPPDHSFWFFTAVVPFDTAETIVALLGGMVGASTFFLSLLEAQIVWLWWWIDFVFYAGFIAVTAAAVLGMVSAADLFEPPARYHPVVGFAFGSACLPFFAALVEDRRRWHACETSQANNVAGDDFETWNSTTCGLNGWTLGSVARSISVPLLAMCLVAGSRRFPISQHLSRWYNLNLSNMIPWYLLFLTVFFHGALLAHRGSYLTSSLETLAVVLFVVGLSKYLPPRSSIFNLRAALLAGIGFLPLTLTWLFDVVWIPVLTTGFRYITTVTAIAAPILALQSGNQPVANHPAVSAIAAAMVDHALASLFRSQVSPWAGIVLFQCVVLSMGFFIKDTVTPAIASSTTDRIQILASSAFVVVLPIVWRAYNSALREVFASIGFQSLTLRGGIILLSWFLSMYSLFSVARMALSWDSRARDRAWAISTGYAVCVLLYFIGPHHTLEPQGERLEAGASPGLLYAWDMLQLIGGAVLCAIGGLGSILIIETLVLHIKLRKQQPAPADPPVQSIRRRLLVQVPNYTDEPPDPGVE